MSITIGADPEFFIRRVDNGAVVPICGLLGGTKGKPVAVGHYGVQEDNVMAEYNIPPTNDYTLFATHVSRGRDAVIRHLNKAHPGMYEPLLYGNAVAFPLSDLSHPQAMTFGCSPDFDGYAMGAPNPRIPPESLVDGSAAWRFAGGHVHLGYKEKANLVPEYIAAQFADLFIGLSVLAFDKQGKRRQFYGTPGRYRPTPYGIEYRTLSNFWTFNTDYSYSVGMSAIALGHFLTGSVDDIRAAWNEIPWMDVRRAIENEDANLGVQLRSYAQSLGIAVNL